MHFIFTRYVSSFASSGQCKDFLYLNISWSLRYNYSNGHTASAKNPILLDQFWNRKVHSEQIFVQVRINLNVPNDKNFFGLHFAALTSIQWKAILLKEHFYFHAPALPCYKTTRISNWQKKTYENAREKTRLPLQK